MTDVTSMAERVYFDPDTRKYGLVVDGVRQKPRFEDFNTAIGAISAGAGYAMELDRKISAAREEGYRAGFDAAQSLMRKWHNVTIKGAV